MTPRIGHYGVSISKHIGGTPFGGGASAKSSIFGIPYICKFFDKVFFSIDNSGQFQSLVVWQSVAECQARQNKMAGLRLAGFNVQRQWETILRSSSFTYQNREEEKARRGSASQ